MIELPASTPHVVAIIVTFHPNIGSLCELVDNISRQVRSVFVVDNTPGPIKAELQQTMLLRPEVIFLRTGVNVGLAAAQNLAIEAALSASVCGFAITLDQDSQPGADMVERLLAANTKLLGQGKKIGAIGPNYIDPRYKHLVPFVRLNGFSVERSDCRNAEDVCEVDYLIASGSLVSFETLRKVGLMKSEFFIDYIDIEWGLRAKSLGYQSYGVCAAQMLHSLGDQPIQKFGRSIPVHSPLRHYYHFRNGIWLHCRSSFDWKWKVVDAYRLLRQYVFYSLFIGNRMDHFVAITQGIIHGLMGRLGQK